MACALDEMIKNNRSEFDRTVYCTYPPELFVRQFLEKHNTDRMVMEQTIDGQKTRTLYIYTDWFWGQKWPTQEKLIKLIKTRAIADGCLNKVEEK